MVIEHPVSAPGASIGLLEVHPRLGADRPGIHSVTTNCVVGRGSGVDIPLEGARVSDRHASIERVSKALRVRDLGSRFGTRIDGVAVGPEPVLVRPGAVLRFGDALFLAVKEPDSYVGMPLTVNGSELGLAGPLLAGPRTNGVWARAIQLARIAKSMLIQGETGTGKEVVVRLIHRELGKAPLVALNIAAVPDALFESELFGHERGAFTGADTARLGAFREARGGILFLDEIGDLSLHLQAKLLRAIELRQVRPLGAAKCVPVELCIVAATSRDLWRACEHGTFRKDLFYRLAGATIQLAPLRERREEILPLALANLQAAGSTLGFDAAAAERLLLARWDGNVRQLRFAVTHALCSATLAGRSEINSEDLPMLDMVQGQSTLSRDDILAAFREAGGVASRAARLLRVSRTTLYASCKRRGLEPDELRAIGRQVNGVPYQMAKSHR